MTIGIGGGFDVELARMMALHQIESEKEGLRIVRDGHEISQTELQVKNAAKINANDLQSAMSYVQMGMSAVKVGSAAQNLGNTIDTTQSLQQGMNNPGTEDGDYTALHNAELMGGGKVGDRFTDSQLDVLTGQPGSEVSALSDQDLRDRGFTDKEVTWLRAYGSDGLSHDEGVTFMMQHPSPEHGFNAHQMDTINGAAGTAGAERTLPNDDQLRAQGFNDQQIAGLKQLRNGEITQDQFIAQNGGQKVDVKNMIKEGFLNILTQTPDKLVENAQKDAQKQAKASDEIIGIVDETTGKARDNISSFKDKLLDLELKKIEDQAGINTHASSSK